MIRTNLYKLYRRGYRRGVLEIHGAWRGHHHDPAIDSLPAVEEAGWEAGRRDAIRQLVRGQS